MDIRTGEVSIDNKWAEMLGYELEEISPISLEKWKN